MKYIIFDLETTCLDVNKAEIWQFSGIVLDFDNKTKTPFNYYFKTKNEISMDAREKCNITPEVIATYPSLNTTTIINTLEITNPDVYYIGHNIKYDRSVVINTLERAGIYIKETNLCDNNRWIDTYRLAKRYYNNTFNTDINGENLISLRLSYLYYYFHLYDDNNINFHDAQFDVEATLKLLKYICKDNNLILSNADNLVELSNKPILLKVFNFGKHKGENIAEFYNQHSQESESYFRWLCNADICDKGSMNFDPDLYYTLEKL